MTNHSCIFCKRSMPNSNDFKLYPTERFFHKTCAERNLGIKCKQQAHCSRYRWDCVVCSDHDNYCDYGIIFLSKDRVVTVFCATCWAVKGGNVWAKCDTEEIICECSYRR